MDLLEFFNAKSIAVIGVSHEPKKVGYLVVKNIIHQGYSGDLFLVNPKGGEVLGKKVFLSYAEIPQKVELVILAVPGAVAMQMLDEIGASGVKYIVLYAAGFKETGPEGIALEEALKAKCAQYGITLLGPNCIGFISTPKKINATFLKHDSPAGNIGFVSQSGALGSILVDYFAAHSKLGFSYFISLGNKAVLDECHCLEFLAEDPHTEVIGMYLEDVRNGEAFLETLARVTKKKPVVILKSGRTSEGSKAALSHTGGMVGDDQVFDAAFKQCGAIRADGMDEFLTLMKMCSFGRLPFSDSVLILTNAGGVGVLMADEIISDGLTLTTISEKTKKSLQEKAGSKKISLHNPIDILGDANALDYQNAIEVTLQEKNDIGCIAVLLTPQANTQIYDTARIVSTFQKHFTHPIYPIFMGEESINGSHRFFEERRMTSFRSYDGLAKIIKKIGAYRAYKAQKKDASFKMYSLALLSQEKAVLDLLDKAKGKQYLSFYDSMKVFSLAGVKTADPVHVHTIEEARKAAKKMGYPLVAKIASDEITHKTEAKGVYVGISSETELENAYTALASAKGADGCYLQPQKKGYELFVGAKRDHTFGTVIVLGVGGIFAELYKDVSMRVFPFSYFDFERMLTETKAGKLIAGFRGSSAVDPHLLYNTVMSIGALMSRFPQIKEIDANPIMISDGEAIGVDARIIL